MTSRQTVWAALLLIGVVCAPLPPAAAADLVEWGPESTPQKQFELILSHEISIQNLIDQDPQIPALTDDRPINEYFLLRSWFHINR